MKAFEEIVKGGDRSPEAVVGEHQERSPINVLAMQGQTRFPAAEVIPLIPSYHYGGAALAQPMQRSGMPAQPAGR